MKKNKKEKRKLKIVYDIIPPHLLENVILAEKKVSKMVKVFYLFLRTSKYGSAVLVLGVALFGGAIIMGFSSKTEVTEIFPTQYEREGDWQNMGMALERDFSNKANILEFNNNNSASVVDPEEEVYGEFSNDDEISSPEEELSESEIENENEEVQDSDQEPESTENDDDDATPLPEEENPAESIETEKEDGTDLPVEEESTQSVEPTEKTETKTEEPAASDSSPAPDISSPELFESPNEEVSFFEKTKSVFFIPEAKADEIDEIINSESQEIIQTETEEISNGEAPAQNEDVVIEDDQNNQNPKEETLEKETIQVGDTEPTEDNQEIENETTPVGDTEPTEEEENFEDYSVIINIPDIDGNLFSETEEDRGEETQTIFTKELSTVYSNFSISEEKGELKKTSVGFSFASIGEKNEDDEIIISWSLGDQSWNVISEFVLNESYSNKSNGGYFYTDSLNLSNSGEDEVLEWEDIKNVKVKFAYLTNNNETDYVSLFLDAVWLETESEKPDEEIDEEQRIEVLSSQKDFKMNEEPEFKFKYKKEKDGLLDSLISIAETIGITDYWDGINLTAEIMGPDRKVFEIPGEKFGNMDEIFTLSKDGEILMNLKKDNKFKPGLYKIILKIEEEGKIQIFEYDFTWGVLAINVNKSIYLPGEEAYLQMAVLKDDGHTICNAGLKLQIMNQESGIEIILSTEDETIYYSGQCSGNNVTDVPDYFAYYTTGKTGAYEMKLTNLNNDYEITDSFEVRDFVPFEIERIGPSRIYPPADYEMVLKIKANKNFSGFVQEKVPSSFEIMNQELRIKNQETGELEIYEGQFIMQNAEDNSIKLLRWYNLNLKQNDELEIRYSFDAPDVSPDLHLLGPLGFYE